MKKFSVSLIIFAVLMAATVAFAHSWGTLGSNPGYTAEQQKFFDETKDLRKEMHEKRFNLMELYRNPDADSKKIAELEKELYELRTEIRNKAGEYDLTRGYGPGNCGGPEWRSGKVRTYRGGYGSCENCLQYQPYQGHSFGYGRMMY